MSPIPASTFPQIHFDVATPTGAEPPAPDKQTSPGISAQNAPPAAVSPASGKSPLQQLAENAVAAFVAEQGNPSGNWHAAQLKVLQNEAISRTEAYLAQELGRNSRDLPDAYRLARQARWTAQGQAERANEIATKKYTELFAVNRALEKRLNARKSDPLTDQEKRHAQGLIAEAKEAATRNRDAWVKVDNLWVEAKKVNSPPKSEPYGDGRMCVDGRASAVETMELVTVVAGKVAQAIAQLDQPKPQLAADNR